VNHFVYTQSHQRQNGICFVFTLIAVIWSDCEFSNKCVLPNELVKSVNNNVFFALTYGLTNDVTESDNSAFRYKALWHCYSHWQCHTTERCHIGRGTHIFFFMFVCITSLYFISLDIYNIALTVSQNRALPHWYRHWQYHTTDNCYIGTGTDSITKQNTATLVQALTVSHNIPIPCWYRHSQYHSTEHCHIGTGTHNITQQSTATLVQALTVSHSDSYLWQLLWPVLITR
jgi:hypothetical protein